MARKRLPINQMNVVPYIDVMLVLLVIFMVTAPLVQTTAIDLPQSSQPNAGTGKVDMHVTWLGGNQFTWQKNNEGTAVPINGDKVLLETLKQNLPENKDPKPIVVFSASEKALYGEVMDRVDALRQGLPQAQVQLLMKKRQNP